MSNHIKKCIDAITGTCINRKAKLKQAYDAKEGRIVTTLGAVKTAVAVVGYGLYAGMPPGLREYEVYDGIQDPLNGPALLDEVD